MSQELKFKIATPSGEFRRLRFPTAPTWAQFQESLVDKTVLLHPQQSSIQYVDEEGDRVSIGSQQEWQEALDILAENNRKNKQDLLKLFVVSKPQAQKQVVQQNPVDQSCENIKSVLGQVLQNPNLESLLSQLPGLLGALNIGKASPSSSSSSSDEQSPECRHRRPQQGDGRRGCRGGPRPPMEGCAPRPCHGGQRRRFWFHKLHRTAFQFLIEKNYPAAKACYEELLSSAPQDNIALYNLACTYSLLSSSEEGDQREELQQKALDTLRKAVTHGYSNFAHANSDADFEPIRTRQEFADILASMKDVKVPEQPSSQPEPQQATSAEEAHVPEQKQTETEVKHDDGQHEPGTWDQWKQPNKETERVEFEAELKQLEDMGFTDRERNLALLRRKRGNLGRVLARLLD